MNGYNSEAAEFEIKRLQDAHSKAIGRILNLEGTCQAQSKGIGRLSNEKVMLQSKVEELEAIQAKQQDLLDALTAPNVSYFDMTPAEEIARLEARLQEGQSVLKRRCEECDRYRAALESILWQTKDCNGILFKAVHATANEALNPE